MDHLSELFFVCCDDIRDMGVIGCFEQILDQMQSTFFAFLVAIHNLLFRHPLYLSVTSYLFI